MAPLLCPKSSKPWTADATLLVRVLLFIHFYSRLRRERMWRSVAAISRKSSLRKLNGGLKPPIKSQVLLHSNATVSAQNVAFLSQFSFHQNPRFFSQDSWDPFTNDDEIPQVQSVVSEQGSVGSSFDYADNVFDDLPESNGEFVSQSSSSNIDGIDEYVGNGSLETDKIENGDEVIIDKVESGKLEHVVSLLQNSEIDYVSLRSSLQGDMSVELLEEFVISVIQAPTAQEIPGANLIAFVKLVLEKDKLAITTEVLESLVLAVKSELKRKSAYALWDLFKLVGDDGVLTTEILNSLIGLLHALGKGKAAFEVFNKFEDFNCVRDEDTFYFTVVALCSRKIFDWAASVAEVMVNEGRMSCSDRVGEIISYLCKGKKARDAHAVYLCAKKQDKHPPRSSVNLLISSLCQEESNVHLALEMLEEISKEERKHAIKLFSSVIKGLCRIKDLEKAKALLFKMIESGPPPGNSVFNSIINSLSKAGEMMEATKILKLMESRGLKPDVYTYSVIMSGYVKGGEMEEACKVLAEAKKKHSTLCPVTYHILIRGYCKLENFDKALELLSEMKQYGVQPTADEYNKLIQSLCLKALDWKTAEKLLEEMENNGLHLNGITKGLINAVKELEEEEGETEDAGIEVS